MARPSTREQLANYCLRALGAPVVEINIDEDQLEDRIDEAIQFYQEYHSDAVVRTFVKHQITSDDVNNNYISLPEQLISVLRVFPIASVGSVGGNDIFSSKQLIMNDLRSFVTGGNLIDYEMTRQYMSLIDMTINGLSQQIIFNRHQNRLKIEVNWAENGLTEGRFVILEGYQTLNPDEFTDVYNDMMLKKYLTALIKKQWGQNLNIKFEGLQLPGGVTISGRAIYDDAKEELLKIEEEFDMKYSFPPDFFVG